jgi:hypothetical protein
MKIAQKKRLAAAEASVSGGGRGIPAARPDLDPRRLPLKDMIRFRDLLAKLPPPRPDSPSVLDNRYGELDVLDEAERAELLSLLERATVPDRDKTS